jgi:hypothetical protein
MSKKLYRVDVVLYVMAEDESTACAAATKADFDVFECSAEQPRFIDPFWEEAVPYNADDERTCEQIMHEKNHGLHPAVELLN